MNKNSMFEYNAPEGLLNQKIILVTGASQGIGRAAAKAYASLGATVLLLSRSVEQLETLYDEIIAAGYPEPAILPFDLNQATDESLTSLVNAIDEEYGRLDGLLNNASVLGFKGMLRDTETLQWTQTMQVNVNATFMLTRDLLPLLEKSPSASVVFTSSSVGRKGRAFWGGYAVSKFATEGMMEVFADEMSEISNIRFNCINPGGTNTLMRRAAYPGENPNNNPSPEDIMPLYLYLMGNESSQVNGQSLDAQPKRKTGEAAS